MFTFGPITDWQGDPAVKQILVFPHATMQEVFEHDYAILVERVGVENASDSNLGAVYKLRATKQNDGTWRPSILCGLSGFEAWVDKDHVCKTHWEALYATITYFRDATSHQINTHLQELFSKDRKET